PLPVLFGDEDAQVVAQLGLLALAEPGVERHVAFEVAEPLLGERGGQEPGTAAAGEPREEHAGLDSGTRVRPVPTWRGPAACGVIDPIGFRYRIRLLPGEPGASATGWAFRRPAPRSAAAAVSRRGATTPSLTLRVRQGIGSLARVPRRGRRVRD